ncbi:hypothetical protein D3C84_1055690 [compost metagenome]
MDRGPVRSLEANCDTVADTGRLAVGRLQDEERRRTLAPDRAIVTQVRDTLMAQLAQYFVVEAARILQVVGANCNVSKDTHSVDLLD